MDAIASIAGAGITGKLEEIDMKHMDADGQYNGRTLCGNPLGHSAGLLITAGLQTWDSFSDIAVTLTFAYSGDINWFLAGFSIQVVCGCVVGLMHAHCCQVRHGDGGGRASLQAHSSMSQKAILAHTSKHTDISKWLTWTIAPVLGILGVIPATVCVLALKENGRVDSKKRVGAENSDAGVQCYDAHAEEVAESAQENTHLVYLQAGLELVLESMPQAVLQTYIAVSYGQFDQHTATMSRPVAILLAASICCSFLASGVVMYDLESEERNQDLPSSAYLHIFSLYGVVTIIGRAAQVASLVFANALCACAFKATAFPNIILAVILLYALTMYSKIQCKGARRTVSPNTLEVLQYVGHAFYVLVMMMMFYLLPHMDNDYGGMSDGSDSMMPFDCKQRHTSIAVLWFSLSLAVVFMFASLLLDPQWGCRADASTRRQLAIARAEEDALAELRVARAWVTASISGMEDTEAGDQWQLEDKEDNLAEIDLQDSGWVVREYRRQMLAAIGKQVQRACELHCKQTGQPCNREAQWKYRERRKLRWEASSYFLYVEYAAWEYGETHTESNLHDQHIAHKEHTQQKIDVDEVRDLVDEYESLFESFLLQTYAHPRCYKWEEQALWEASEKVVELEEQLSFTTMFKLAPRRHRFSRRRDWVKQIVRLVPESDEENVGVVVDSGKPSGNDVVGGKIECFDITAFNLANHHDEAALQPVEALLLKDVTHCRDPQLNSRVDKRANHAIELVSPTQTWIVAAESIKDKRRWLKKMTTLLPSHTAMDEALEDLHSEAARRKRGLKRRGEHKAQLETQNPTFERSLDSENGR